MAGTSTYNIDIVLNNKAAGALGKMNGQLKKIEKGGKRVNGTFDKMKSLAIAAAGAFGSFKIASSLIQTAVQFENLAIQLNTLTGSATEGARALKVVEDAAADSAFAFEDMANSSALLLTVGDVDQLASSLEMVGDIAAVSGLEFDVVAGQIQRAFSGGIASADIFREKGIKSMLGFQEGVQYTAQETEDIIRKLFENGTAYASGGSKQFAKTWTGQLSLIGDKITNFKKTIMDASAFAVLKEQLMKVNAFLKTNEDAIAAVAESIGNALAMGINKLGEAVVFAATHIGFFANVAKVLVGLKLATYINKIIPAFKALNLVMRANPIGLLITAVAALIGYLSFTNGLGRTIVQIEAAFGVFGEALSAFTRFMREKVGKIVERIKNLFYDFVDAIISSYNWIAKLIPGMDEFNTEARALGSALSEKLAGGLEYVGTKAGEMSDALLNALPPEVSELIDRVSDAVDVAGYNFDKAADKAKKFADEAIRIRDMEKAMASYGTRTPEGTTTTPIVNPAAQIAIDKANAKTLEWFQKLQAGLFPLEAAATQAAMEIKRINDAVAAGIIPADQAKVAIEGINKALADMQPQNTRLLELTDQMTALHDSMFPMKATVKEYEQTIADLNEALDMGIISQDKFNEMLKQAKVNFDKTVDGMSKKLEELKSAGELFVEDFNKSFNDKLADGLVEGNLNFDTFADLWKSTLKDLISDTLNGGTKLNDILGMFGSGGTGGGFNLGSIFGGGGGGGIGDFFSSAASGIGDFFGGFFADGGKLGAGKFGVAGENGPELITGPAKVLSNEESFGNMGSAPAVNITIQAIDTQTGTEFLLKNKKQITGIIQGAYNKRGKQGIY
tara:strand:+ start:2846 stop:5383 length:2538 start_codon:yes stop_codon:yes gene_type:complete